MTIPDGYIEGWEDYLPGVNGFFGDVVPLTSIARLPGSGAGLDWGIIRAGTNWYPQFSLPTKLISCKELQIIMRYDYISDTITRYGVSCALVWWDGVSYTDSPGYFSEFYPIYEYTPLLLPLGDSFTYGGKIYSIVESDNNVYAHRLDLTSLDKDLYSKFLIDCWGLSIEFQAQYIGTPYTRPKYNYYFYSAHACRVGSLIL
jgi:hypothetical protein